MISFTHDAMDITILAFIFAAGGFFGILGYMFQNYFFMFACSITLIVLGTIIIADGIHIVSGKEITYSSPAVETLTFSQIKNSYTDGFGMLFTLFGVYNILSTTINLIKERRETKE
jgi:hypothetical protein